MGGCELIPGGMLLSVWTSVFRFANLRCSFFNCLVPCLFVCLVVCWCMCVRACGVQVCVLCLRLLVLVMRARCLGSARTLPWERTTPKIKRCVFSSVFLIVVV